MSLQHVLYEPTSSCVKKEANAPLVKLFAFHAKYIAGSWALLLITLCSLLFLNIFTHTLLILIHFKLFLAMVMESEERATISPICSCVCRIHRF